MTNEGIIRIARTVRDGGHWNQLDIIRFAHLVAAHERTACAEICREVESEEIGDAYRCIARECEDRIRARGGGDA